jgi:hypothetical protein
MEVHIFLNDEEIASCPPRYLGKVIEEIEQERGVVVNDYIIECGNQLIYYLLHASVAVQVAAATLRNSRRSCQLLHACCKAASG